MATVNETALPEVAESSQARTAASILTVVWQRKSLVILGLVIGLVLGSLFYAQRQPIYQSVAQVHVINKMPGIASSTNRGVQSTFQDDYMGTQKQLLGSQVIAEAASKTDKITRRLNEEGFHCFPDAKKPDDLVIGIMGNLVVSRDMREGAVGGNNILNLQYRGTDREECKIILEALIEAYDKHIGEVYSDLSEKVVKQITDRSKELETDIKSVDDKLTEFYKKTPVIRTPGGMSLAQSQATKIGEGLAAIQLDLKIKTFTLESFEKILKEGGSDRLVQYVVSIHHPLPPMTGDPETDRKLQDLRVEEQTLLSQYGEKHPLVLQNRLKQEKIGELVLKNHDKKNKTTSGQNENATDKLANAIIDNLKTEVQANSERVVSLEKEHGKLMDEVRNLAQWENNEMLLRDDRERKKVLYGRIQQMIADFDTKNTGGYRAYAITRPTMGSKISPNPYQIFTAAGLLGMLLGVGLAYLAEISDKSFRNPMEIRKRLGLPVIGHVPFLTADEKAAQLVATGSSTLDPMLVTHYQSNSIGAEAYRGVRTALYFSTHGAGHQVIQVTSPNVSDGKSTLAANLAVSIAQSGKRTLLIDADFRKPRIHKIFNVPAQVGMASVMAGQCDLGSATQQTAVPNLSVMPCGPRPVNPAELLTSPKFKELLEELRHQFDFVVVDTPPILVVTDPAVVAPRVDGVVLCIRVTKNGRPYAERAREVLASLGANVLGVVVNGFGAQVGGNKYGYEHYQYGYGEGYSYTYGYTYGYADKEAASYYSNNSTDEAFAAPPAEKV